MNSNCVQPLENKKLFSAKKVFSTIVQYSSHTSFITGIMTSAYFTFTLHASSPILGSWEGGNNTGNNVEGDKVQEICNCATKSVCREGRPTRLQMLLCIKRHHKQPMESNRSKPGLIIEINSPSVPGSFNQKKERLRLYKRWPCSTYILNRVN